MNAAQATQTLRRIFRMERPPKTFKDVYLDELGQMGMPVDAERVHVRQGQAGEPWVAFTPVDRFGIALSGGGIRSATFNLGMLQALAQLRILPEAHYLSTVSGGGYVGGFWTAWRKRISPEAKGSFPVNNDGGEGERAEIRHLREFSRFLLPRVGILETELWSIAMTVLGGLLPSLLAAISVLFLGWSAWVGATALLLMPNPSGVVALGSILAVYLVVSECAWLSAGKCELNRYAQGGYILSSVLSGLVIMAVAWLWRNGSMASALLFKSVDPLRDVFAPALVLGTVVLILLVLRVGLAWALHAQAAVSFLEGFERALARLLGFTTALVVFALLWWIAGALNSGVNSATKISISGGGALLSGSLFAWAKKWLTTKAEETHGTTLLRNVGRWLKRATPKMLANLTVLLLFILVGVAIQRLGVRPEPMNQQAYFTVCGGAAAIILLTAFFFDPARVGMHEFYRTRIARCYLGASNPDKPRTGTGAQGNRHIIERVHDDLFLKDLRGVQPVHLICTAANDISGDCLASLYRGARSAVLSAAGITLGDKTASLDDLRVSSALTASAAAFNSQMGRISMDLGPAVTFLMSALNLRLGLWVPHPDYPWRGRYWLPGRFFLLELFGRSRANARHLHLSDGNHFENFGLYELIRRHVRYIIVSDCGADPELAFDDLANVLRRVREDFGVEVEIDISTLRPGADGLARQHAAVGTIHYNGLTGMDKGTIIFFKSTLTGDEPPDVLQYRTRNRTFPHETTGDQFYDEAQWESYRRLGEHAARTVLGFFEKPSNKITNNVDALFREARSRWHATPDSLQRNFLDMTERCAVLESDVLENGPELLRAEVFSEVVTMAGMKPKALDPAGELAIFSYLMRLVQIMEDVWVAADLEHYWSHPLNEGWMNYFHRWAATPSFRRWWPILAPVYSPGFREFAKERFKVGVTDTTGRANGERNVSGAELALRPVVTADDRAAFYATDTWRFFIQRHPLGYTTPGPELLFAYDIQLRDYVGAIQATKLTMGFAMVVEEQKDDGRKLLVRWHANELYVPESMNGSGILSRLLDALISHYRPQAGKYGAGIEFAVEFGPEKTGQKERPKVLGTAARYDRVRSIEFYKSRGFQYEDPEDEKTGRIILTHRLGPSSAGRSSVAAVDAVGGNPEAKPGLLGADSDCIEGAQRIAAEGNWKTDSASERAT